MLDFMEKNIKKKMLILIFIIDDIQIFSLSGMRYRDDKIYRFLILARVGISTNIKNDHIDSYYRNILAIEQ